MCLERNAVGARHTIGRGGFFVIVLREEGQQRQLGRLVDFVQLVGQIPGIELDFPLRLVESQADPAVQQAVGTQNVGGGGLDVVVLGIDGAAIGVFAVDVGRHVGSYRHGVLRCHRS